MPDGAERSSLRVVFAPDSFKGSVPAAAAAAAMAEGWRAVRDRDHLTLAPMADGGEGTIDAFAAAFPGAQRMPVTVTGPDGRGVQATWLLLPDGRGVVELAATSGITLADKLRPLDAHTRGFGQAISAALDHGVPQLLLALGGSCSTDGGLGALRELGAEFLDASGRPVGDGGAALLDVASVDLSSLRPLPPGGALVLSDVTNPLHGSAGAARVFGPQKGANDAEIRLLEDALRHLSEVVTEHRPDHEPALDELSGSGAAGGTGYGLLVWGAEMAPGSNAVGEALGMPDLLCRADIVITGEGRFDDQSMAGKVPSYVAGLAEASQIPVGLIVGEIMSPTARFWRSCSLVSLAGSTERALADPLAWLTRAGACLAGSVASVGRSGLGRTGEELGEPVLSVAQMRVELSHGAGLVAGGDRGDDGGVLGGDRRRLE